MTLMCRRTWLHDCEFIDQQLRGLLGAGNVKLDVVDDAQRDERLCNSDFEINVHGGLGSMFQETWAASLGTTNACADLKHDDKSVDERFAKLFRAKTLEERTTLAREIERYVSKEKVYLIHMWKPVKIIGWRSYVKGFLPPAEDQQGNLDHAVIWLDK